MLDSKGFDLWADGYDESVGLSEEDNTYPFAGYKQVLNRIFQLVMEKPNATVLDIGFGTGTLTTKLYENGCTVWGQDFSERMLVLAKQKMPEAYLYVGDFAKGLKEEILQEKYDAITATYSLHHLDSEQKISFIKSLLPLLKEDGKIIIGDVAFRTLQEQKKCKELAGEEWDDEEFYFIYEELKEKFPQLTFEKVSFCSGVFILPK